MLNNPMVLVILTSLFASIWPILAKMSGASNTQLMIFTSLGPLIVGTLGFRDKFPEGRSLLLLFATGMLCTLGTIMYTKLVTLPKDELSTSLPLVTAYYMVFLTLGGLIFLGESLSLSKIAGIGAIILGVLLLSR